MNVAAAAEPAWPPAWFEPPQTAAQLGLTTFEQSPVLEERGLPPVEERLPDDPVVSVPLESLGHYGGTARIIELDSRVFYSREGLLTISPDHKTILPNLAESWHYSDDGRRLTVKLRKGLKWSDGHPLTSSDALFMTNDLQLNTDYQPETPLILQGLKLHATDPWTLVYEFDQPSPLFINYMAQSPELFLGPKHYFARFHPAYRGAEQVAERMREMGFINWTSFVQACRLLRVEQSVDMPTARAFRPTRITPILKRFERNPYYFKVDPGGRQLPYIDAIEAEEVRDGAVAVAKASTGQLDFAAFTMPTQDIPLLKLGEQTSGIKVNIWRRIHGSDLAIQLNYNHADAKLRKLFWDVRFRRALSLAIDRNEMNEIIYFGRGVPRQVTVIPESDYFDPKFATAYTQFDPGTSNRTLDELGLHDVDGDGLREHPDGSKLTLTVEYVDTETPKQISMELVASYWKAVGIDIRLKLIDRGLQYARAIGGKMEMTVWHADRTTDILFPVRPDFWVPRVIAASTVMWNEWARWYMTEGEHGEEPPSEIRDLQRWADELRTTMDRAARIRLGKQILASNAENLWSIGTVGQAPHPVVVSKRLKNVNEQGYWGWDTRWTLPYHPATWYLEP
jgi:peptide/nickel transport system substrate-binding protein